MAYFKEFIEKQEKEDYYIKLHEYISKEYETKQIFPPRDCIFNALRYTPYENIKVLVVGQDPYHGVGEAHGLSFSVNVGIPIPPSLKNIYKELNRDVGTYIPNNGYLLKWAKQGVMLLNSVLTVEKDKPGSHRGIGWEIFTDRVIEEVNKKETPVVFVLWGNYAKEKEKLITNPKHLILKSAHPSPFSCRNGFEGCSHFSKINEFLKKNNMDPIDWQIENV